MDLTGKLKPGMRVVGPNRADYGTVERYDDAAVYVGGRPIPYDAFERLDGTRLYVGRGGAQHFRADGAASDVPSEGELRVPLVEERLLVETRTVELAEVEVHRAVESEQVSVPIELRRDEVDVRVVDIEERPLAIGEGTDAFATETIRVPVRGEEVLVSKEAVVTAEVVVGVEQVAEIDTVSETLREEVVDVSPSEDDRRSGAREHLDRLRAQVGDTGAQTFRANTRDNVEPVDRPVEDGADGLVDESRIIPIDRRVDDGLREDGEVLRVPEVEEHLRVERRRIALGFVEVRKRVVTERLMVPVELRREVVEYRLIDDPGGIATVGEAPGDLKDDAIRIPVFSERPVVHTETVVASEVVIDRRLATERRTLDETLRRTTVAVDDNTVPWQPLQGPPGNDGRGGRRTDA